MKRTLAKCDKLVFGHIEKFQKYFVVKMHVKKNNMLKIENYQYASEK